MPSFVFGTRVLMDHGRLRMLPDVHIGEKVIGSAGEARAVMGVQRHLYRGPLVLIRALGATLRCTPDVRFLTTRHRRLTAGSSMTPYMWTTAHALRPDTHLLVSPVIRSAVSMRRLAAGASCGFGLRDGGRAIPLDQIVDQPNDSTPAFSLSVTDGTLVVEHFVAQDGTQGKPTGVETLDEATQKAIPAHLKLVPQEPAC